VIYSGGRKGDAELKRPGQSVEVLLLVVLLVHGYV
jgi:hypothetical protein